MNLDDVLKQVTENPPVKGEDSRSYNQRMGSFRRNVVDPSTYPLGECATTSCSNRARWLPVSVANQIGNKSKRRCHVCCDAIAEALNEIGDNSGATSQTQ